MIKTNWGNDFPMTLTGMATSLQVQAVTPFTEEDGYDVCVCTGCEYEEDAYVNNGGPAYKNDYKTFIGARRFATDTITFKLLKDGLVVATLNASTYGVLYDFGNALFVNSDVSFPDYKAFYVDWNLVQLGFGYGKFVVRVEIVSLGVTYTYDSHKFNVVEYNAYRADGTVKIEGYQNGNLQKHFDFTGLNFPQMYRLKGKFGDKTPTLILDDYKDFNRKNHEIQSEIQDTFILNTELLPSNIFNYINYILLRANTLLITDYNLQNQELYRTKPVKFNGFKEVQNHELTRVASFVYEFKHKTENDIKRNAKGDDGIFPFRPTGTGAAGNSIIADFSADLLAAETGDTITFTDESTGSPTSWYWDFGSGATPATSILQNPTVVYSTAGAKTVTLIAVKVGGGDTITKTGYITVTNAVDADAQAIFDRAVVLGSAFPTTYKTRINNTVVELKANGDWTYIDWLTCEAMIDTDVAEADRKILVSINFKNPAQGQTLKDDYSGAHVGGVGYVGNGTNFAVLTDFQPSLASNYARNAGFVSYLCLSDTSASNISDLHSSDGAFSTINLTVKPHTSQGWALMNQGLTAGGTYTYQIPRAYNHQWRRFERVGANIINEYDNGMLVGINTDSSAALTNDKLSRFGIYYGGAWYAGLFGAGKQGALIIGGLGANRDRIEETINENLLAGVNKPSYMNKNIVGATDSIFSSQLEGVYSRMFQKTITDLADHWTLSNLGASGKFASDVDADFNTKIGPYFKSYFVKNVFWIALGTNDISGGAVYIPIVIDCTRPTINSKLCPEK